LPRPLAGGRWLALLPVAAALAFTDSAFAHADLSPPTVVAKASQMFTLAVPNEKERVTVTRVELTVPDGFTIDSFAPAPGWSRDTGQRGSAGEAVVGYVSWSSGDVAPGEAAVFQFVAEPGAAKTYTFKVRQTYSDGSVVDWSGGADTPAPAIEAKTSLSGGGDSSPLPIVDFIIATLALVAASIALLLRAGGRELA
jgi:uncharacterized protein YcnI